MHKDMELWTAVRHALFVENISKREASRRFRLNFRTIQKIYGNESPSDYERDGTPVGKLTPYLPFLQEYLEEDKKLPPKQRHTCKRIYERLRDEHGYPYTYRALQGTGEVPRQVEAAFHAAFASSRPSAV